MRNQKLPFILTREEKNSPLWGRLMTHWEERLDYLRTQNEMDKTENQTANLRGKIAECKANMELDKDLPIIDAPPQ